MAVLLNTIPGYGLTRNDELLESCRDDAIRAIDTWIASETFAELERRGICRLVGHFDAFPESVKRWACHCPLRPYACFDRDRGCVWIDASCAGKPNFAGHVLACVGMMACVALPGMIELCAESLAMTLRATKQRSVAYRDAGFSIQYRIHLHDKARYGHCLPQYIVQAVTALKPLPKAATQTKRAQQFLLGTLPANKLNIMDMVGVARENVRLLLDKRPDDLIVPLTMDLAYKDIKRPVPLGVVASISSVNLPEPAWFVNDSAQALEDNDAYRQLVLPDQDFGIDDTAWVASQDDEWPLDEPHYVKLSSPDVRPLARLHGRVTWADRGQGCPSETQIGFVRTAPADMPSREVTPGCRFPIVRCDLKTRCRIERVTVGKHLDWAVARLSVEGIRSYDVRALVSTWTHQAGQLKTATDYSARVAFWATAVAPVADDTAFGIAYEDDKSPASPAHLVLSYAKAHFVGRFGNESYVEVIGHVGRAFSRRMSVVIALNRLHACGPLTKGTKLAFTGLFVVSDLLKPETDDEIRQRDSDLIEPEMQGKSPMAQRRFLRREMQNGRRSAFYHMAHHVKDRLEQLELLEIAAEQGFVPAMCAAGILSYELELERDMISRMPVCHLIDAVVDGSDAALKMLALPGPLQERLPIDLAAGLLKKLAIERNNGLAQYALALAAWSARERTHGGKQCLIDSLYANFLMHAVVNGVDTAGEELAHAFSQGIGVAAHQGMARAVLTVVANRGYLPAQYWLGAFDRMGPSFFTATLDEKRAALARGVDEGLATQQMLLGMFYELDAIEEPDALLIAHSLYSWVAKTLQDNDALELQKRVEEKMSPEELEAVKHFDVWQALGMKEPPASVPLSRVMGQLEGPITMHPTFLRCLDPDLKDAPTERLLSQVSFFAANSTRYKLGYAAANDLPFSGKLKVTSFGAESDVVAQNTPHLLVCSAKGEQQKLWDVTGIYPFFPYGMEVDATIQSGLVSESGSSAVLLVSASSENRVANTFTFFDPLWPLMNETYRTGETYRMALYGLADTVEPGTFFMDSLPAEIRKLVREQLDQEHGPKKLVSFSSVNQENAAYRINAVVRGVEEACCEIAGIEFIRIEIDPFIVQDGLAQTFPVMVPVTRLPAHWRPKVGERVDILLELHGYAVGGASRESKVLQ